MNLFKYQQGLAFLPLVFTITLLFVGISLTIKIVPVYINHSKVVAMLDQFKQETSGEKKSEFDIKSTLTKRININNIDNIAQDDITLSKQGSAFKVMISYEVVKKIYGNLSVLIEFNDHIEIEEGV